jgi:DNA-binding LytR/AlgR family response regulator
MIRIVIVEDEAAAVERLIEMLSTLPFLNKVVKILDSVTDSIDYFTTALEYDIILMDIHLSDGNSFDIFKHVAIQKPIIFTTAYSEYALAAFKQYAVDYLLKPVKKEQLASAINKYTSIYAIALPDYTLLPENTQIIKKWVIKIGQHIRLVAYPDVVYYYSQEKITYLMTFEGKKYPVDMSLEQIESQIIDQHYFRINRQYIIHQKAIASMSTYTKSRVKIKLLPSNEEVIVSTERSPHFKKWLRQ